MTGVSIDVRLDDRAVLAAFARLAGVMSDTTPVMRAIGVGVVASTHRRFISQTSPEGKAWAPLNPDYKAMKRNTRILTERGRLRDSINARAGRDHVRVGTNVIYAAVHQLGATIKPKNASHLVFRLASGLAIAKSVTIPERPYLGISDEDEEMVGEIVFAFIQRHT